MTDLPRDPDLEWLDHARPTGLVLSPAVIKERTLVPQRQTRADTDRLQALLNPDPDGPVLPDPWAFARDVLGWDARLVAGPPGGVPVPDELVLPIKDYGTVLAPDWAVKGRDDGRPWQLLVRLEPPGADPDQRPDSDGWEATRHQRFERLLRETGVLAGLMLSDTGLRFIYAPRGETSGWLNFPLRSLATVAGRPMLAGLKLLLDKERLFTAPPTHRLHAVLKASREAQAAVSAALAEQVLGALHELLRGCTAAEPELIGTLARDQPRHLYEALLTVLLRLVFILYAEDRDLLPSRQDEYARSLYEAGYAVRGLYARLSQDAALNPDTMDERYGAWGRLLALFRLIHEGYQGFINGRGGKLFHPEAFPVLSGQRRSADGRPHPDDKMRVVKLTDGCLYRVLDSLMTLHDRDTKSRQRLSYRTLDVEQIGSVYETIMGFTVETAPGRVLAIKAGKNNKTPVFADLDRLATLKPADRVKYLKEECNRASLPKGVDTALKAAKGADAVAAALDPIVDPRGAPNNAAFGPGTPILQPTEERRRTGSHYTPRTLTEPIVRHALEPAFERLGPDATPEQVLELKVCDPAMGSGAFLVEACRQLAARLVQAWARWPETRPVIPADEDEDLHARRLVAQRCLYGVDKNPWAVDLAKLSLWLATLARDHEFTFLDHALKCGDSLVGLTRAQIAATHWDTSIPPTFVGKLVSDHLRDVEARRRQIQHDAEFASEAELMRQLRAAEARQALARLIGNGVIAAFFSADKPKKRIERLVAFQKEVQAHLGSTRADERLTPFGAPLATGEHPITPFHWDVEFPEVFSRKAPGFDVIIGNPPYLGGTKISNMISKEYFFWISSQIITGGDKADIVAYFFRRFYNLICVSGTMGIVATSSITEGDTRKASLAWVRQQGGVIYAAKRKRDWPGEASVNISEINLSKAQTAQTPLLDGEFVTEINSFLKRGGLITIRLP